MLKLLNYFATSIIREFLGIFIYFDFYSSTLFILSVKEERFSFKTKFILI